jgi:hypothetical protein
MLCGIVLKPGVFPSEPGGRVLRVANESGFNREPMTGSSLVSGQGYEAVTEKPANSYQVIVERNVFALKPAPPPSAPAVPALPPKEDLFLTGLMNGFDSAGFALFMVTVPGQPPLYFTLAEGEQNDWLEVLSVDVKNGTVKARLNKPVMRIRNVGVEVVLSFEKKNH